MTFTGDIRRFTLKLNARERDIFTGVVDLTHDSIQNGSAITAAPGQPVDTGNLRDSWQKRYESSSVALVATKVEYAPYVEENVRGVTFKNHGPHSVKLTVASFDRIVEHVTRKVVGNGDT